MAASNSQDLLAIVPKKVVLSTDRLLPTRNLKPVANVTPAKKTVVSTSRILPSRNLKPVANVTSAKKIAVPKSSISAPRNVKLATPVNRTLSTRNLRPTANIVTAKQAATSKPQTLRTLKPVSNIVQTRPSVIDNYVQSNRRIALQKASANLMKEIADMDSPVAAANLIQNKTVVESDVQVPEALLRARANKVLSPLVLKPVSKPAGTPVFSQETVREIVAAVPAPKPKYDMQAFVDKVKREQSIQPRANDPILRIQVADQKSDEPSWKDRAEETLFGFAQKIGGAEVERVTKEEAAKIDSPTTSVQRAIVARGESSTNYPVDAMDQESDKPSTPAESSQSDDVTNLPANPKRGDTGTWYDGRTVTWDGARWQLPQSEDTSEKEPEPEKPKPVKSTQPEDVIDSTLITRGDNTYRPIREIDPSDLDDIDRSGLYYIERPSGRKSVLSGESLMGVSTSGAKVTEVELVDGTPTRSDIDIKKYIKGSEEGRVVAIGKSYYDALVGNSKNKEVTERQIADSLASGKMGISVDQTTGKVKISPFTKDPTAITQDHGVFRALPYKTLKSPEGKKVDVPEWAYKKLQHVGQSDKEIAKLDRSALKTISVGNIGTTPISHQPKKSGILNALDYYYDEAVTQAKALSYDADTRLVNDGLFTREAIEKLPDSALGWASVALNTPYNYMLKLQGEGDTMKGYNMKPTVQGVMYLNGILDDLANGKSVTDIQSTDNMLGYELVKYAFLYGDKEKAKNVANKNPRAILQLASDAGDFPEKLKDVIGGSLFEKAAVGAMSPEEKKIFSAEPNAADGFSELALSLLDSTKDLRAVQKTSTLEVVKGVLSPGITSSAGVNWALALPATILKPVTMVAGAAKSLKLAKGAEGAINAVDETGRIIGRVSSAGKDSMVVTDASKGLQYTLKKEGDELVTTVSKVGEDTAKATDVSKLPEVEPAIVDDVAEAVPAETTPVEELATDAGYVEESGYVEPSYAEASYGGGGGYADTGGSYVDEAVDEGYGMADEGYGAVDEGYGMADEGYGAADEGYEMAMPAEEPSMQQFPQATIPESPQTTEIFSQELGTMVRQNADGSMSVYDEASGAWLGEDDYKNLLASRQIDEVPTNYVDDAARYNEEPSVRAEESISQVDEISARVEDAAPPRYVEEPSAIARPARESLDDVSPRVIEETEIPISAVDEPSVSVRTVEEVGPARVADDLVEESQRAVDEASPAGMTDDLVEESDGFMDDASPGVMVMSDSLADKVASSLSDDALLTQKVLADDPVGCAEHAENILAVAIRNIEKDAPLEEVRSLLQKAKDANAKVREKIRLCKV